MSQALIDELKRENLCTHFVLPLLKLSKVNFHSSGFVNCYLTKDCKRIAVRIMDTVLLSRTILSHPEFSAIYKDTDGSYLVMFRLRNRWQNDLMLFVEGKYSKFSADARSYITRYSGLPYKKKDGNRVVTDGRLLIFEKPEVLKEMWGQDLYPASGSGKPIDDPELHLPSEFLSKPGEESFINPESLTRVRVTQL